MSRKKSVFIGFDTYELGSVVQAVLPDLVTTLREKHGCAVSVPWKAFLRNIGVRRVRKLRDVGNLDTSRSPLCVFLTESISRPDTDLYEQIRAAHSRGLRRLGIIMKVQNSHLISEATFEMFRSTQTNYATAVHTFDEALQLVVNELAVKP